VAQSAQGKVDARRPQTSARRVEALLAEGPRHRDELFDLVGADSMAWNGVGVFLDLARAPPPGTWEHRRADVFALADDWLGPSVVTPEEGVDHLVRRYLSAFGPARANCRRLGRSAASGGDRNPRPSDAAAVPR
jgi:Winged helix DNA-binding domain